MTSKMILRVKSFRIWHTRPELCYTSYRDLFADLFAIMLCPVTVYYYYDDGSLAICKTVQLVITFMNV